MQSTLNENGERCIVAKISVPLTMELLNKVLTHIMIDDTVNISFDQLGKMSKRKMYSLVKDRIAYYGIKEIEDTEINYGVSVVTNRTFRAELLDY